MYYELFDEAILICKKQNMSITGIVILWSAAG
jgi:hypothetical protein